MYMDIINIHIGESQTIRSHNKVIRERELFPSNDFDLTQQLLKWDMYTEFYVDKISN
jgi:hypothetical protein